MITADMLPELARRYANASGARAPIDVRVFGRVSVAGSGCWEFSGSRFRLGYGSVTHGGKVCSAHRLAYEIAIGPIPEGMHVIHACDNPPCVNPAHLRAGTHSDNMNDKMAKGRGIMPRTRHTKLSKGDAVTIREMRGRCSQRELSERFGISQSNISRIQSGERWSAQ
jgi:hypothetical protein